MKIDATDHVSPGAADREGSRLAQSLLARNVSFDDLEIDVSNLPVPMVISVFFNGFLQQIFDTSPELLPAARNVVWIAKFPFQAERIAAWVDAFEPVTEMG